MKAQELRIGNLVIEKGKIKPMYSISNHNAKDYSTIKPIPLTEEWLLRFGFVKEVEYKKKINFSRFHLFQINASNSYNDNENEFKVNFYQSKQCVELCRIKHVHQLQNLYFALTGEELTL